MTEFLKIAILVSLVVLASINVNLSRKATQRSDIQQKVDLLTQTVNNNTHTIVNKFEILEKKIEGLEKKIEGLEKKIQESSSKGSSESKQVMDTLYEVKTNYLATLTNKTPIVTYEDYLKYFWLNTKVELVKDHSGSPLIGGSTTRIAIKNHNSYLMATKGKGYIIVENGEKIYEHEFRSGVDFPYKAFYLKDCNCYFLLLSGKLFKKGIDGLSAEVWVDGGLGLEISGWGTHNTLAYSSKLQRMVVNKSQKTLVVINPTKKGIEFEFQTDVGGGIGSSEVQIKYCGFLGENDEKILFITHNRHLGILRYDTNSKKGEIIAKAHYPGQNGEGADVFDIDSRNKVILITNYVCVGGGSCPLSSITAFEFWNNKLTQTASLNVRDGTESMHAFKFVKNHKNQSIFVGIDTGTNGGASARIYRYDSHAKVISEDKLKRLESREIGTLDFIKHEDWFYYSGKGWKLMRLKTIDSREE